MDVNALRETAKNLLDQADSLDKLADRYKNCSYYATDGSVPGDFERRQASIVRSGALTILENTNNVA